MTVTTRTGRKVYVKVVGVGTNFGVVGIVRAMNNRTIAETDVYPLGAEKNARAAAVELAKTL